VLEIDPEAFETVVDVNMMGVFYTVRAALPSVIERRGYVLIVSSLAAFVAGPGMASYDASKAGVEHLANALRLELAYRGVGVGSAHMSWIDTPMVKETKAELATFRELIATLPGPMKKTTSVEKCGEAFVKGIEGRKRRIYCPGWVGLMRWMRPLIATPVLERDIRKLTPDLLPRIDAEAAALGRHFSARTEALEKH
jgi:NAD(P)-dependent dehydrogenase (short-subunit alcohol dehydrogenase family)